MRALVGLAGHLRIAVRTLRRAPLASLSIVATLALSIGATTGVFSIVYAVLFRGLPYREPERLVWIASVHPDRPDAPFTLPEFMDYRERARSVDIGAYANWSATLQTEGAPPQRLQGMRISAAALRMLGVRPAAGRLLEAPDDAPDADRVAVLGYAFWRRQFGGDAAAAVGRTMRLNGEPYAVVGVLPRHFPLPLRDVDVAVPLSPERDPRRHVRSSVNFLRLFGRLRGGATEDGAERELSAIATELRARFPTEYATKIGVRLTPLRQYLVGDARQALLVLLGSVALMLAIAFANVLNLLLIRATERQGEIAVRRALGASARHVARQLLAEGALLAGAGALAGVLLAYWGVDLIAARGPASVPRLSEARVDRSALLFVAGLSTLATALLSLAPLAAALRAAPQTALQGAGRGGAGRRRQRRLRGAFIVAEVALAVTLTAATAVLLESLVRLERVDLGYRPDSVFVARVSLPPQRYSRPADVAAFYDRLHATLERQPGVVAAGVVSVAPLSGLLYTVPFSVAGRPPADRDRPSAHFRAISPGYLTAIRASLVAGRAFTEFDDAEAPRVALVSRALAERYFAGTDPIGQQLLVDDNDEGPRPLTVVGVVRNLRHVDLEGPPTYDIYIPLRQVHRDGVGFVAGNQFWTVRVTTDPLKYRPTFLTALREADPDAAASGQSSMAGYVDAALAPRRFAVALLLGFAVMAVVLAAVGVYGVMAYSVAQRRREIGVRLALGARPGSVVGLVLRQALALSLVGVVLGAGASLLAGRAVAGLLFGVAPSDPVALAAVAALLAAVSAAASWIPARRAARIDPAVAMSAA